jgi:hypothetical protein
MMWWIDVGAGVRRRLMRHPPKVVFGPRSITFRATPDGARSCCATVMHVLTLEV